MNDASLDYMDKAENLVRELNRNTKFSPESKIKPQKPSSLLAKKVEKMKREKKLTTSEIWLG